MARPARLASIVALAALLAPPAAPAADDFPAWLVSWRPDPSQPVVFRGAEGNAWDRKIRERGWITASGGVFHLWYTGYNDDRSPMRMLGHASSADGRNWVRDASNPIHSATWVEDVCVVESGGTSFMFAEGKGDVAHLLTSTDGVRWEERGPLDVRKVDGSPIAPGPFGTPAVLVEGDAWYLFYERGDRGVWLAKSTDHAVWTNVRDEPVLAMGPEPYDSTAVAVDQVFKKGGVYYAIYHANATRPWTDWSTCVARSTDLIRWEKYAGNPIVGGNSSSGMVVDGPDGPRLYTMHPEVRLYRPSR